MKISFNNNSDLQEGFTLVETLVAIGILVTALAAPLTIAHVGLRAAHYAQDSLTAQMLASEAIEYIRNVRDDNFLREISWTQSLRVNQAPFRVDVVRQDGVIEDCEGSCETDYLSFNSNNKLYSYRTGGAWDPSAFARAVEVDRVNDHEIIVRATVWWTRKGVDHSYTTREHLLSWYE